ncbi:MAG: alpha/beta hydrolase [Rhizobiaceae bacterium]
MTAPHPVDVYPAKYRDLIDEETWAFIEHTNSWYPPDTATLSIDEQRKIYDRMCREFFAGYPGGVEAADGEIHLSDPDRVVPTRHYRPNGVGIMPGEQRPDCWVIYYHGGGFVVGGLESHDDVCAEICAATGYPVMSVDYRLGPEHTFPSDFEDAVGAFTSLTDMGVPLILVGDSAGGNLAAAVSHHARAGGHQSVGQVLIYPGLGGKLDWGTFITHADAPMLTTADTIFYKGVRTGGDNSILKDPRCAPLEDTEFSCLPPTVVFSAECDPLCGDGQAYADKINTAGGKAIWLNETGLVHGYLRARHCVSRARDSFKRICDAVSALGKGAWPY